MTRVRSTREKRWIAKRLVEDLNSGKSIKHAVRREGIPYTSMIDIFKGFVIISFQERYPVDDQLGLFEEDVKTPPISSLRAVSRRLVPPNKK